MRKCTLAVCLILCLGLTGCGATNGTTSAREEEKAINRLPWPKDGLYGMATDGYLGFLQTENKQIQLSFIQVRHQSGAPEPEFMQIAVETETGDMIGTSNCLLLHGSSREAYRLLTLNCTLEEDFEPGTYSLTTLLLKESNDGPEWRLPTGNIVLEILPGEPLSDVYAHKWNLNRDQTDEYRVQLRNDGEQSWTVTGVHEGIHGHRPGTAQALQVGSNFEDAASIFTVQPAKLGANSSASLRIPFEHQNQAFVMLRPVLKLEHAETKEAVLLPLETTYYVPPLSPRDVLQFTKDPSHLRTIDEAIRRPSSNEKE